VKVYLKKVVLCVKEEKIWTSIRLTAGIARFIVKIKNAML